MLARVVRLCPCKTLAYKSYKLRSSKKFISPSFTIFFIMSCIFCAFALLWGQLQWQLCLKMPCKGFLRATRQMRKMLNLWLQKGNQACGIPCRQCWPITFTMSTREGFGAAAFPVPCPLSSWKATAHPSLTLARWPQKRTKDSIGVTVTRNSERKTECDHRDPCVVLLANSLNPVEPSKD